MAGHSHHHSAPQPRRRSTTEAEQRLRRRVLVLLTATLVPVVIALIAGAVLLWPQSSTGDVSVSSLTADAPGTRYTSATVTKVTPFACQGVGGGPGQTVRCAHVVAKPLKGPGKGQPVQVDVDPTIVTAGIQVGDGVQLARFKAQAGLPSSYAFVDFTRGAPIVWLAVAFALLVVLVARIRGLGALLGLALSFGVLIKFMIPALLSGENPLAVGLVGCAAIMFVLLYLAHGVSIRTTTALIGTLFGLGASALLAVWAVDAAHLTGVASEDDLTVAAVAGQVGLSGLLLCGIVVASLGILNDITVTQASAVWELHALQPDTSPARLFRGAMRIGRDHIASTVYTIVFAYAGSALPVLLLINLSQRPLGTLLTSELLAQEIIRTLVGSIGLVLAVPVTTAVGVALVRFARGSALVEPNEKPERDRPWATLARDPSL